MKNLARTALLLEEKAAKLPRSSRRRAELLAYAQAFRLLDAERQKPEHEIYRSIGPLDEHSGGSFDKRAYDWMRMALSLPDGNPQKDELLEKAQRAAAHSGLRQLSRFVSENTKAG